MKGSLPHSFRRFGAAAVAAALIPASAAANAYTNHAGHAVSGVPVALDKRSVTLADDPPPAPPDVAVSAGTAADVVGEDGAEDSTSREPRTTVYPLSIFPESERRRIAADFGEPLLPEDVKRAVEASERARRRSVARAAKGLCTQEESDAFCRRNAEALAAYLEKEVAAGRITSAEADALHR